MVTRVSVQKSQKLKILHSFYQKYLNIQRERGKTDKSVSEFNQSFISCPYRWGFRRRAERGSCEDLDFRLRHPFGLLPLVFILPLWPLTFQLLSYKKNRTQPEMTRDIQRDWGWSSMAVSGQWKGKECFSELSRASQCIMAQRSQKYWAYGWKLLVKKVKMSSFRALVKWPHVDIIVI